MRKCALIFSVALASVGILLSFYSLKPPAASLDTRPFVYGQTDVVRFLKRNGITVEVVDSVMRNASGEEPFVVLFGAGNNELEALRITTSGIKTITSPGRRVFAPIQTTILAHGSQRLVMRLCSEMVGQLTYRSSLYSTSIFQVDISSWVRSRRVRG